MTFAAAAVASQVGKRVPGDRNAALPGALLLVTGLFLIVWALRDWGVIGEGESDSETTAGPRSAGGEW